MLFGPKSSPTIKTAFGSSWFCPYRSSSDVSASAHWSRWSSNNAGQIIKFTVVGAEFYTFAHSLASCSCHRSYTFMYYVAFFVTALYLVISIVHTIRRCRSKRAAQKLAHDLYLFLCTGIKYTLPVELVMTSLHDCRVRRGHKI